MRIAMLIDLFYPYQLGGAERQFYELAKRLAKRHEVHVYTLRLMGREREEVHEGIRIHRVGLAHPLNKRSILALLSFFPFALIALLRDLRKFDLIHANQVAGLLSFFLWPSKRPFLVTIHDLYLGKWESFAGFPLALAGRILEQILSRGIYSCVLTVSRYSARKLLLLGAKRVAVVPNGIEIKAYGSRRKENLVVYVGRLVKYKHVDVLVKAMSKLKTKVKLIVIGEGEERARLELLARQLNVDVSFLGYLDEIEKREVLARAKVFCNLSSIEGFGIAVVEAAASGAAIIVRDLPCYREYLSEGSAVFLSDEEANDAEQVARVIDELLKDEEFRSSLAKKASEDVRALDWDFVSERIEELYRWCLE